MDLYGTLGELFALEVEPLVDYLGRLRQASGDYKLLVESPLIAATQDGQIEKFAAIRRLLQLLSVDRNAAAAAIVQPLPWDRADPCSGACRRPGPIRIRMAVHRLRTPKL
ncbi:MAG: hypothetical protein ACREUZ_01030 [Burkholderiales bacterium]